jgi:hypothetical protein
VPDLLLCLKTDSYLVQVDNSTAPLGRSELGLVCEVQGEVSSLRRTAKLAAEPFDSELQVGTTLQAIPMEIELMSFPATSCQSLEEHEVSR